MQEEDARGWIDWWAGHATTLGASRGCSGLWRRWPGFFIDKLAQSPGDWAKLQRAWKNGGSFRWIEGALWRGQDGNARPPGALGGVGGENAHHGEGKEGLLFPDSLGCMRSFPSGLHLAPSTQHPAPAQSCNALQMFPASSPPRRGSSGSRASERSQQLARAHFPDGCGEFCSIR